MKRNDRKRVLVVENDDRLSNSLRSSMEEAGFETQATWSSREALSALESKCFDVLLVDDYLPDQHITCFLQKVARVRSQPSIVVMHGKRPRPSLVRRFAALGASAVVDKHDAEAIRRAGLFWAGASPSAKALRN